MEVKSIEQNLRSLCRQKGLSLTDVANRMGSDPSNLLSSIKGNPKLSTLEGIANALNVSISELVTKQPVSALGVIVLDGQTYQLAKPQKNVVQIPHYSDYDMLRSHIGHFVEDMLSEDEGDSFMGMVETFEVFCLNYNHEHSLFTLTLCYEEGLILTTTYDKLEYCDWKDGDTEETVEWNVKQVTEDIINDIEEAVLNKIQEQ